MKFKILFYIAGIYDAVLGVSYLFLAKPLFKVFNVPPPNHWGYIQFPALVLIMFGVMFIAIARDIRKNYGLILYGIGLKAAYSGVVFYHWMVHGIPTMWIPFAIIDFVFMLLFIWAYQTVKAGRKPPAVNEA